MTEGRAASESPRRERVAVVACGALSTDITSIAERRGWGIDVHPLPPLLHNHPEQIAGQVETLAVDLLRGDALVVVGYADCGTYGALDEVCARLGVPRLRGDACYDVLAGDRELKQLMADEPGTYLLTDFLAASFHRSVVVELGLDRHPELRDDYFRHYTRVVWLAQEPTPALRQAAQDAATVLGLPLEVVPVGDTGLERALEQLLP